MNFKSVLKSFILIGSIISAVIFPIVSFATAGINKQLPYQGVLKTSAGVKVSDGNYDMIFKIYDAPTGGNILWTGTHTVANGNAVTVTDGIFGVLLGSGSGNTITIDFSDDTLYLGIKVGVDSEMTPRKRIGAAGYAFNADKLDGVDSSSFARLDQANTMQSSLTVNGALTFSNSAVSIPNNLNFDINTLFIDATNNRVGVGMATPGSTLDVKGVLRLSGSTSGYVGLAPAAAAGSITYTLPSADGTNGQMLSTNGSGALSWATPASQWTTSGSNIYYNSGNVIVGHTATINGTGYTPKTQITGGATTLSVYAFAGDTNGGRLILGKSKNGTVGTLSMPLSSDTLGTISFSGAGTTQFEQGASIYANATENWTSTARGSKLIFQTTANGTTANSDRLIIDQNGNVGIGTNLPGSKLEVSGQVKSTAGSGGGTVSGLYAESIFPALAFYETGVTADNRLWDFFADGEALSLRAVNDANSAASNIMVVNRTGTTVDSINFDSNTLFIDAANNRVGVGTVSPRGQFDVTGTGDIYLANNPITGSYQSLYLPGHIFIAPWEGSNISYLQARRSDSSGTTELKFRTSNAGTITEAMHIKGDGNVGIAATTLDARLNVTADTDQVLRLERAGLGSGYIYANDNEMFGVNDGVNYPFMIRQTAPGYALYVNTDGRIGLNTGTPNQGKMEVKGGSVCVDTNSDGNAASCIANESDARLKENVMTIDGALDKILRLRGVSFDWKVNDPEVLKHYPLITRFASSTHSLGLIAQEAQNVVPEAIMQETVGDDEAQYLQLDYDKIIPLLVEGVKEIASLADSFKRNLVMWFADATNDIGDFFAKRIHTETICLKKSDGKEYCVNGDDLEAIMIGRGENVTMPEVINMQTAATTAEIIDVATEQNTANNDSDITQNKTEESYQTQIDIDAIALENAVAISATSATKIILAPIEPTPEP